MLSHATMEYSSIRLPDFQHFLKCGSTGLSALIAIVPISGAELLHADGNRKVVQAESYVSMIAPYGMPVWNP